MTISNNKLLIGASGGGSDTINVEDVFSTFLYEGNGGTQTINNGIDIDGEGGLVWIKNRDAADSHVLTDTVRGATKILHADTTAAEATDDDTITAFNSTGFALGDDVKVNTSDESYVAWTFRKHPKFFDVVTYTGNGASNRTISHNLDAAPGMLIIQRLDSISNGAVWHKDLTSGGSGDPSDKNLVLNNNYGEFSLSGSSIVAYINGADSSSFSVGGNAEFYNGSGHTFVAYLFAHNDGDGEFGPDSDQDIIKCGYYTGNGLAAGQEVDLGFEPQFVLYKCATQQVDWRMVDNMRGVPTANNHQYLRPNLSSQEYDDDDIEFYVNGFRPKTSGQQVNGGSEKYIYWAIRKAPMAEPEDSSNIFGITSKGEDGDSLAPAYKTGFPVDFSLYDRETGGSQWFASTRAQGGVYLKTDSYDNGSSESADSSIKFDFNDGFMNSTAADANSIGWNWRRAPKFFETVAYKGNGGSSNPQTVAHGLGIAPGMIWVKAREISGEGWYMYHSSLGTNKTIYLHRVNPVANNNNDGFYSDAPTSTVFSVFANGTNKDNENYIAFLFGEIAGITKLGSVSHSGSSTNVDCGFSNGAKFVYLRRYDGDGGPGYIYDTFRGINSGNDPYMFINSNAAQVTNTDLIDPLASGFTLTGDFTDGNYIFYAIATPPS